MKYILHRCKDDTSHAVKTSAAFRAKQKHLSEKMTQSNDSSAEARILTLDIQSLSGVLFAVVLSIQKSLQDLKDEANVVQAALTSQANAGWWQKIWKWCRRILLELWQRISKTSPVLQKAISIFAQAFGIRTQDPDLGISQVEWSSVAERIVSARETCESIGNYSEPLKKTAEKTLSVLDERDALEQRNRALQTQVELLKLSK